MTNGAPEQPQPPVRGNGIDLKTLNWPTVILILVTGGGNWLTTVGNRNQIDYTRDRVFKQVQDLHDAIEEFEKRQKEILLVSD